MEVLSDGNYKLPQIGHQALQQFNNNTGNQRKIVSTAVIRFRGSQLPVELVRRTELQDKSSAYLGDGAWIPRNRRLLSGKQRRQTAANSSHVIPTFHYRKFRLESQLDEMLSSDQTLHKSDMRGNFKREWFKDKLRQINIENEGFTEVRGRSIQLPPNQLNTHDNSHHLSEENHYKNIVINGDFDNSSNYDRLGLQMDNNYATDGTARGASNSNTLTKMEVVTRPTSAIDSPSVAEGNYRRGHIKSPPPSVAGTPSQPNFASPKLLLWNGSVTARNKIDMNTVRWRSWMAAPSSTNLGTIDSGTVARGEDDAVAVPESAEALYKVTQKEFQRLTDQNEHAVLGSSSNDEKSPPIKGQYKTYQGETTSGVLSQQLFVVEKSLLITGDHHCHANRSFKGTPKDYQPKNFLFDSDVDLTPIVERSQIAQSLRASIKAFQDRKWLPYHPTFNLPEKPSGPTFADIKRPLTSKCGIPPVPPRKPRLKSAPVKNSSASQASCEEDDYDQSAVAPCSNIAANELTDHRQKNSEIHLTEDPNTNFSDALREKDAQARKDEKDNKVLEPNLELNDTEPQNNKISIDDLSDNENIEPEPSLYDINIDSVPNLELRPENLDDVPLTYAENDLKRYNFDATTIDMPLYQFKSALPDSFMGFSFREAARRDRSWQELTKHRPEDPKDIAMLDRIQELEKLQRMTELAESQRKVIARLPSGRIRARSASATVSVQRQTQKYMYNANLQSTKDNDTKKCIKDSVQPGCVEDYQHKVNIGTQISSCVICRKSGCNGTCGSEIYDRHSRLDVQEDFDKGTSNGHQISFKFSTYRNTNNSLLNRPKSSVATINHTYFAPVRPISRSKTPISGQVAGTVKLEYTLSSITLDGPEIQDAAKSRPPSQLGHGTGGTYFCANQDAKLFLPKKRLKSSKKRPKTAV